MLTKLGLIGDSSIALVATGYLFYLTIDANQRAAKERGGVDAA
nr:hypothetical protein [Candidatus Sigynarchaeota archaeon]